MHKKKTMSEGNKTWQGNREKKTHVGIAWVNDQEFA